MKGKVENRNITLLNPSRIPGLMFLCKREGYKKMHEDNRKEMGKWFQSFVTVDIWCEAKKSLHIPTDASVQSSPSIPSTMRGKQWCEYIVSVSSKHRLGSVEVYTWEYHSLPVGVLAGCNGNICLCHRRLQSGLMLWIKSPRQSRRFQMLQNTPVCSEMLRTLCNILWHLNFVTNYYYLIIFPCSET